MNVSQFKELMADNPNIIVASKNGIKYIVNHDLVDYVNDDNDLIYGYFVSPNRRTKALHRWFKIKNISYIGLP